MGDEQATLEHESQEPESAQAKAKRKAKNQFFEDRTGRLSNALINSYEQLEAAGEYYEATREANEAPDLVAEADTVQLSIPRKQFYLLSERTREILDESALAHERIAKD